MRAIIILAGMLLLASASAHPPAFRPATPAAFDFQAWANAAPSLNPDEEGDDCSRAHPHFRFGANARPDEHAFACRQDGPHRGWHRQRIRGLHVVTTNCPDGATACDAELVRLCRAANMEAPCAGTRSPNTTGPNRCAVCGTPVFTHHAQ